MNIPIVNLGLVAVSRDCFPLDLSKRRRIALTKAISDAGVQISEISIIIENELDVISSLKELSENKCNALVIFLGNFGPEGPETLLAQKFCGPTMFIAASEENTEVLSSDRGDAYCGMLNASYNLSLRGVTAYIPEYPIGTSSELAKKVIEFIPIARTYLGIKDLKIITFGPRPYDFLACNSPIKPLFDLGISIQENSEMDLFVSYRAHAEDLRIPDIVADMANELGSGNTMPDMLPRLAQYELTLMDWIEQNRGAAKYVAMANKCWPAFESQMGFVPCYVNSRLTSRLIPIACEVDVYGALSEYIIACVTEIPPLLLDINNNVPFDLFEREIFGKFKYEHTDTFMGFHCGNAPICHLNDGKMKYQLIMKRAMEPNKEPDITRGTLEGDIKAGEITLFRLQSMADASLHVYIAQGEVLPVATHSFGSIGIFAISEMARFYRHVLVEKRYPHHGAFASSHIGRLLYEVMKLLDINDISFNHPKNVRYSTENPFR